MDDDASVPLVGRARLAGLLLALIGGGAPGGAKAASSYYLVTAQVQCPYYQRLDNEWDTQFRDESRKFLPCHGLHVVAKQPGTFGDTYCGEDYTAWDGSVKIRASTDCAGDLFLSVEASSLLGYHVGTHDFPWWRAPLDGWLAFISSGLAIPGEVYDFLIANKTFEWHSASMVVAGGTGDRVNFGTFRIGATTELNHSRVAADVYSIAGLAMQELSYSGYRPADLAFTIDHPVIGVPTTVWNTVLFKDSTIRDPNPAPRGRYWQMIRAIPHETGHATYNRYHSGQGHWLTDARYYLSNHAICEPLGTLRFGWYEGFADFVESYVYPTGLQQPGGLELTESPGGSPYYHLARGCYWDGEYDNPGRCTPAGTGFDHEGNVQALLDQVYYGPYRRAFDSVFDSVTRRVPGMRARDPHRPGRGELALVAADDGSTRAFSLPSIGDAFGWVAAAGSDSHTAREFLDGQIGPWCASQQPIAAYCSSALFQSELAYLDASSSVPSSCGGVAPPVETAGTPVAIGGQLGFADALGSPVSALHFGAVPRGQTAQVTIELVNAGTDPVAVDSLGLGSEPAFAIGSPPALPLQLAPGGRAPVTIVFTPSGLAVSSTLAAASTLLAGLSLPGGSAQVRVDGSTAPSGQQGRIAFVREQGGDRTLWTINADGTGLARLTSPPEHVDDPRWSPDGRRIYFATDRNDRYQLFVMSSDGSGAAQLTTNTTWDDDQPGLSPDGGSIVFRANPFATFDLWMIDASGAHLRKLIAASARRQNPAWSPDGTLIAFASDLGIAVTDPAGSAPRSLTGQPGDIEPSWSPDGRRIAYSHAGLFLMDADGSSPLQLTSSRDRGPTWSPDGNALAFSRTTSAGEQLYVIGADGTGLRSLTAADPTISDFVPTWSRQ